NPDMQAYEVKVKWLDLETIEDSWEPSKTMCEDVPHILLQFANNGQDDTFVRAVTSTLERKSRHLLKCRRVSAFPVKRDYQIGEDFHLRTTYDLAGG
ncbi:hypothetical protein PHMEG_00031725, partial [Phytophthora megakarya]